jgi:hypothetical protein
VFLALVFASVGAFVFSRALVFAGFGAFVVFLITFAFAAMCVGGDSESCDGENCDQFLHRYICLMFD